MAEIGFKNDRLVWDYSEPVTLEQMVRDVQDGESDRQPAQRVEIQHAKRTAPSIREIVASGGGLVSTDVKWAISTEEMAADAQVSMGDVITDGEGARWTVIDYTFGKRRNTWHLTCRNLAVHYELRDVIDVQRPEIVYDGSGAAIKRFPPGGGKVLYDNLRCRVQPTGESIRDERGIRGFVGTFDVILDREVDVTNEDRLLYDGHYLEVRAYDQMQRLGDPPIIRAELVP